MPDPPQPPPQPPTQPPTQLPSQTVFPPVPDWLFGASFGTTRSAGNETSSFSFADSGFGSGSIVALDDPERSRSSSFRFDGSLFGTQSRTSTSTSTDTGRQRPRNSFTYNVTRLEIDESQLRVLIHTQDENFVIRKLHGGHGKVYCDEPHIDGSAKIIAAVVSTNGEIINQVGILLQVTRSNSRVGLMLTVNQIETEIVNRFVTLLRGLKKERDDYDDEDSAQTTTSINAAEVPLRLRL